MGGPWDQHEGCEAHPVGGDDQCGRIAEFDQDGGSGSCQDPDREKEEKGHHSLNLYQMECFFKPIGRPPWIP